MNKELEEKKISRQDLRFILQHLQHEIMDIIINEAPHAIEVIKYLTSSWAIRRLEGKKEILVTTFFDGMPIPKTEPNIKDVTTQTKEDRK